MISEDNKSKTGIEGFPITDYLEKKITESKEEEKLQQQAALPSPCRQGKAQPSRFALEHWEKT